MIIENKVTLTPNVNPVYYSLMAAHRFLLSDLTAPYPLNTFHNQPHFIPLLHTYIKPNSIISAVIILQVIEIQWVMANAIQTHTTGNICIQAKVKFLFYLIQKWIMLSTATVFKAACAFHFCCQGTHPPPQNSDMTHTRHCSLSAASLDWWQVIFGAHIHNNVNQTHNHVWYL